MHTLDVGCGKNPQGNVSIDINFSSLANVICDAHYLPFRDNVFLRIVLSHSLEHMRNPYSVLEEVKRVLKRGGIVVIKVPNSLSWRRFLLKIEHDEHLYSWNEMTIKQLVSQFFRIKYLTYNHRYNTRIISKIERLLYKLLPHVFSDEIIVVGVKVD